MNSTGIRKSIAIILSDLQTIIEVLDSERFKVRFKKRLVRCVACSLDDQYFNKQALILVQDKQNSGKSTLTRFLTPPELTEYQTENISIDKDSLIALCQNFLIIQDELSTFKQTGNQCSKKLDESFLYQSQTSL